MAVYTAGTPEAAELNRQWVHGGVYIIEQMLSFAGDDQPERLFTADATEADTIAKEHTMSEPWAAHCQIKWYTPGNGNGAHMKWYMRNTQTRELELYREF